MIKKVLAWVLGLYVVATCIVMFVPRGQAAGVAEPEVATPDKAVVVYYFFDSVRCKSCIAMETWTGEVVKNDFAGPVAEGRVVWKPVNTETPGNEHYLKDFVVLTKSVVIAEVDKGKTKRFKNLSRVWELVKNEDAFKAYVADEVKAYLETTR